MSVDTKSTYYDAGGIETVDIIRAKLSREQFLGYLQGNIIKYSCRANFKDDYARDMEKAKYYAGILDQTLNTEDASKNALAKAVATYYKLPA
jgi:hypothetical protein